LQYLTVGVPKNVLEYLGKSNSYEVLINNNIDGFAVLSDKNEVSITFPIIYIFRHWKLKEII
jgi:hypothetical protein